MPQNLALTRLWRIARYERTAPCHGAGKPAPQPRQVNVDPLSLPSRRPVSILRILATIPVWLFTLANSLGQPLPPQPPETIRVMVYNVYNFMPLSAPQIKTPESRDTVAEIIHRGKADIVVLAEMGGDKAVEELRELLRQKGTDYPFATVVHAYDRTRNLAVLAMLPPAQTKHDENSSYNLKDQRIRVRRGFAHCVFKWRNGYILHLLGAHLKSKHFDRLGQTDMRRYEARLLRYRFNDIIGEDPEANVLIVGDMNDTPDSSPISTLCGRRYKQERQLFDLRPLDQHSMVWTHLWDTADSYTRIDYALVSYPLLPEISLEATFIPSFADWYIASDHRPIIVTLTPHETPLQPDRLSQFHRNFRTPTPPPSSLHEGRVIGTRKVRR
ncbi:MAG: endonuclease/exonuclease/phosphatase family protein [Lentisphaerae bacterium]|nr:endonuclease/exonuclease/phosphatase family protein [Lentisphaerota bacterium]MBT4817984.1 endonuclease/exonuclease/phosphatase family protein [Lentisphaerota bacterium]MBT5605583.1 endonuclease/exonuclease/phosphatase family protein [Lentisphaerota bacterium]MBT7054855.1 endonuclease/exonuclease/phosphatase family protein [Lentisphaerota bacterium]MBT7841598.1 endonuclease/exonuclease/phosphatase family protein [Lentisphaerota bacterium]